ncbi:MAG: xanthine dehydrogenase family protein molybdopterin-binding subunit [Alphaproteobacteria bacterium]|nr:xanthine dehydrogenase family protein molybdopterin-binding subunit [Alphaproteobacteria bacterium]
MTLVNRYIGNRYIGAPVERVEDLRFLRGRGEYVADLVREGMLHAAVLRSPVAHGRIRALDKAPALAIRGVHAVITAAEIGTVPRIPLRLQASPATEPFRQPVIASDSVRYVGEPIAVVLADSAAIAEDGVEAVALDIAELPVVGDRHVSGRGEMLLFEEAGTNLAMKFTAFRGDADAAFRTAGYTRRARFSVQRHTALPLEPRGLLAEWDATTGRLTVMGAAKVPHFNRRTVAAMMGLPEFAVDLIENDVGGGFGARGEFYPEDFLIPFAARYTRRPVMWTEDRREHLIAMNHAREMDCAVEIACERDGTILGLRGEIFVDLGAYVRTNGLIAPRNVAQSFSGPYRIPNIHFNSSALMTNKTPAGTYRAPGRYEGNFFCERLIELAAKDLGIDSIEMRRRNLVRDAEMPYRLSSVEPSDISPDTECDSGDYAHTLDRCLAEFGWEEKCKMQGRLIDGRYHGVAVVCFIEGGGVGPKENARLELDSDGSVTVYVGAAAVGQGLETIIAQIAADALGLTIDNVRVRHGSTIYLDDGYGSFASRATVLAGSAVFEGAAELLDKIRAAAARRLGCPPGEIEIADGAARTRQGRSLPLSDLAADGLKVDASFANDNRLTYAYGAAAAHVAVDPGTGRVELLDYLIVEDVGRIINPLTLHGQTIGSTVQGLGGAFMENLVYDANGQLLAGNLADYLIPSATDFPRLRAISLEHRPSPTNPLGAKGAGEGGIIPVGGLMANAVAGALSSLGAEPNELPLSPPRVWRLANESKSETTPCS